jgi:hypothetical protein
MALGETITGMARLKLFWHEMRPHMIAGFFWYLAAFITGSVIRKTYDYLHKNLGGITTVMIDAAVVVVIIAAVLILIRFCVGPKKAETRLRRVQVHQADDSAGLVSYKWKVRIAIQNETDHEMRIKNPVWIANGEAAVDLPQS